MNDRLKHLLRTWVIPRAWVDARRRRQIPTVEAGYKFWRGTPVPAPPAETDYFRAAGLPAQTLTRQDDSRACAPITGRVTLTLPPGAGESGACQFALLADGDWFPDDRVRLRSGERDTTHSHLSPRAWLDVRLPTSEGQRTIEIETPRPVFVTMPRAVRLRPGSAPGVRHVIVLVLDGWSVRMAAREHPTEPGLPLTPNIDRFFRDGLHAEAAFSTGEWSMPTVASFMTGVGTLRHGMFRPMARCQLPSDRVTMAEIFQRAGFHTQAFTAVNRITPIYGHHRGFDRFTYHWPMAGQSERDYDPAVWLADLVGHLDVHQHDRTFSYLHLPDTHPAWHIPPMTRSFNLQRRGDSTGLSLEALDKSNDAAEQGTQVHLLRLHELDRLLDGLFSYIERYLDDSTAVVLTADHGSPWHHLRSQIPKDEPYLVDDRTTILFKMRAPGVPAGFLPTLVTPNLDLMPSLLRLAGLEHPADLDGRDVTDASYARDHVISESVFKGVYEVAVRDGRRVYIEKYPMDEEKRQITGPAHYQRLFAAGVHDYTASLDEDPGRLRELAHAHIRRLSLNRGAAA